MKDNDVVLTNIIVGNKLDNFYNSIRDIRGIEEALTNNNVTSWCRIWHCMNNLIKNEGTGYKIWKS
jgi:hypothetical protein